MTLEEFYAKVGGDYTATMDRLFTDDIAIKYLKRFLDDDTFAKLREDVEAKDDKKAFDDVHTLKGVALNLGLDDLGRASSDLTEILGHGGKDVDGHLFKEVQRAYESTIAAIREL